MHNQSWREWMQTHSMVGVLSLVGDGLANHQEDLQKIGARNSTKLHWKQLECTWKHRLAECVFSTAYVPGKKSNQSSPSQGCFLQDPEACNTISPYFLQGFLAPSTINPSVCSCPCTFRFKLKRTDPHAHTRFVPIMPMMEKIWENQGGCRESRWMCCCVASCYLLLPSHYAWFLGFLMLIKIHWRSSDSFAEMPIVRMPKGRFANTAPFPHRGPCKKEGCLLPKWRFAIC